MNRRHTHSSSCTYSAQRSSKQKDMRFGSVARVVLPAARLLNAQGAPLGVTQGAILRDLLGSLLGQDDVPVLELSVLILFGIVDLRDKQGCA